MSAKRVQHFCRHLGDCGGPIVGLTPNQSCDWRLFFSSRDDPQDAIGDGVTRFEFRRFPWPDHNAQVGDRTGFVAHASTALACVCALTAGN